MGAAQQFLAFDLGAESGRGVLGRFDGEHLDLWRNSIASQMEVSVYWIACTGMSYDFGTR